MAALNFDARQVQPDTGIPDAMPAGWYNVAPDASEIKPTKDGSGNYLEIRLNVLDGQYQGRKLFARFNLKNNNPQAVEIAYKQLSALCHAIGELMVQDSQQLHGRPLKVKVGIKPADGQYEASNEIKAYRNINDQTVGNTGAPAATGPQGGFAPPAAATPFAAPPQAPQQPAQQWQQPAAQQPWVQPGAPAPQQYAPPAAQPPAQMPAAMNPGAQFQMPPQQPAQQPQQFQQPQAPAQQPAQQYAPPQGQPGAQMPSWMQQPGQ